MTLTIELPDKLIEQFHERQVSDEALKAVAIAALEIWLAQQHDSMSGGALMKALFLSCGS